MVSQHNHNSFPQLSTQKCLTCPINHQGQLFWSSQKFGEENVIIHSGVCVRRQDPDMVRAGLLFSWAAPQGTLWTPLLFWSPLSSAVLLCVLWREFLLQKEAWQYVTGAALISTRFISALFTPYKSWSQTLKPQLQCCDYGLSFLHGAGSNNCWSGSGMLLLPPAPTSFGLEIVFKWPTRTFTKYAKMKFSFSSDA